MSACDIARTMSLFEIGEALDLLIESAAEQAAGDEISDELRNALSEYVDAFGEKVDRIANYIKAQEAAGIVWRYQDPDNYYIVRANALENNVVLYKVEGGKRISLEPKGTPSKTYGVKQKVPRDTWSALRVDFDGPRFLVFFDGAKIMEVEDATFASKGKIGLWTKADSVTYFDDLRIDKRR